MVKSKTYSEDPVGHFGAPWWQFRIIQSEWCCRQWASATGAPRLVPFCSDFKLMRNGSQRKVTLFLGYLLYFKENLSQYVKELYVEGCILCINTQIIYAQCLQSDRSFFQFHYPQSQNKLVNSS